MTEVLLVNSICSMLEEGLADFFMTVPDGSVRAPRVANGYLPYKSESKDDFPYVIVRAAEGECGIDAITAEVELIIGAFAPDEDSAPFGHEVCLALMARIRNIFRALPEQVLDSRWQLVLPMSWEVFAEQPYPYWQLKMTTSWRAFNPVPWEPIDPTFNSL